MACSSQSHCTTAALEQSGRRISVVLQQLGRAPAVIGEIKATIEIAVSAPPALADQVMLRSWDRQPRQHRFVVDALSR